MLLRGGDHPVAPQFFFSTEKARQAGPEKLIAGWQLPSGDSDEQRS
jgi:hypothetical protein